MPSAGPGGFLLRARDEITALRYERIWAVVACVPPGRVVTYGDVARAAGLPRGARQVARALQACPWDRDLPWHRVVAAGGRIALPGERGRRQRRLLELEKVPFAAARVALERCRWEFR